MSLRPQNVLYADWVPDQADTISYSSGEITDNSPGWQAYNDLWLMRIDPHSGKSLNARQLVDRSSGWLNSWWGTDFQWSPDGSKLAWVRANSMGLVNTDTGEFETLLTYPVFSTSPALVVARRRLVVARRQPDPDHRSRAAYRQRTRRNQPRLSRRRDRDRRIV